MTPNDLEQLATFMGHTNEVHKKAYSLPDDVYQTAKITKVLLLMEKGSASQFKGKSTDEIDIDMESNCEESESKGEERSIEVQNEDREELTNLNSQKIGTKPPKNKRKLIPWTKEQKDVVISFLKNI